MALHMLPSSAYRGDLGPVGEVGVEYTHLASLSPNDVEPSVRAFIKIYPETYAGGEPVRGLVNEVIGYFVAERAGLPVPPRAGLIALQVSQLVSAPAWLDPSKPAIGFWSEDVETPSIRATWRLAGLPIGSSAQMAALNSAREFLLSHGGTPAVIALDDLLANIDRNLGNLLAGGGKLTLIDHGRCLSGPCWVPPDLVVDRVYLNVVRDLLGVAADSLPYRGSIMAEYRNIIGRLTPAMGDLKLLLDKLLEPGESNAAYEFLSNRSESASIARRVRVVA